MAEQLLLMNAPAGVGPTIPATNMPSGRTYVIDPAGQINASPIDAGFLYGLGFTNAANGGGGSLELTDGSNDVTGVNKITVTGGTVGGSTPNATLDISGSGGTPGSPDGSLQYNLGGVFTGASAHFSETGYFGAFPELTFTGATVNVIATPDAAGGSNATPAAIQIQAGTGDGTGNGGALAIVAGSGGGTSGNGGPLTLSSGQGEGTGNGADLLITAGTPATTGNGGDIVLTPGFTGAGGTPGVVRVVLAPLNVGAVTGPTASPGDVNIHGAYKVDGVAVGLGLSGLTATHVPKATSGTTLADGKFIDTSTGVTATLGDTAVDLIGTGEPGLNVSAVGAALVGAEGTTGTGDFVGSSHSNAPSTLTLQSAGGTKVSPTFTPNTTQIGGVALFGYTGSAYAPAGAFLVTAESDFSGSPTSKIDIENASSLGLHIDSLGAVTADGGLNNGSGSTVAVAGAATLNEGSGIVTTEALVAATTYTLTLTNSKVKTTSIVLPVASDATGAVAPPTITSIAEAAGSVVIVFAMAALTGTFDIRFAVFN